MIFTDVNAVVSFAVSAKLPDWQTKLFKKYREEVQVHSKGQLFYKIDRLFPNEHPWSKEHRILAFEPVTKGSFNKGLTNIMRIFSNSSYTCEASEETMQLITKPTFDNKNLFSYFLEQWSINALANDPNSLIVVYPPDFIKDKSFDQVLFVKSDNIVYYDDTTFIFKSEEESEVKYELESVVAVQNEYFFDASIGRTNIREAISNSYNETLSTTFLRTTYHAFSGNKFYRIEQDKNNSSLYNTTTYTLPGKIPPVSFAGGVRAQNGVFESFMSPFVHFGNLALLQHSQHTAVNFVFSFPRMSEIQSECENPECYDGWVECAISDKYPEGKMPCSQCHGTGYAAVQSPYKTYVKKQNAVGPEQDNRTTLEAPSVQFYTPDTGILDYSKNEWRDYLEMAEMAIFIQQKVDTGNVESAKKAELNLNEFYAFLRRIAQSFYNGLRFVIQCEENYSVKSPAQVTVNIPFSFAILSEDEAFDALNKILTSPAPAIIKGNQVEAFILKFVSQSSPVKKAYNVLKLVDLLLLKNDNEINLLKSNNIITAEQWSIHTFAYPVLMNMYQEDENLFEQDADVIAEQLKTELVNYNPKAPQVVDLKTQLQNRFAQSG